MTVGIGGGDIPAGFLFFSMNRAFPVADEVRLALYVGSNEFKLSKAHGPDFNTPIYHWRGTGLDWSSTSFVTLRLRGDITAAAHTEDSAAPLTAAFEGLPEAHDGETAFAFRIAFSEAVTVTPEAMRTRVLTVTGGAVTGAARVDGEPGVWAITVTPDGAVCTADGRALSIGAAHLVNGPGPEIQPQEGAAPAAPTGLTAEVSHDSVALTWDDPITGYVILRRNIVKQDPGKFTTVEENTGTTDTAYTDGGVEPETRYAYRIRAINAHGTSSWSGYVNVETTAAPTPVLTPGPTPEPPASPTGLSAEVSHDSVVLTWDDPGDDSITGYVILRRNRDIHAEGEFTTLMKDTSAAATTYTDDSVAAGTPYTYRIKAINGHGVSERSRWFHIDTPAAPTPEPESVSEEDTDLPNDNSTPGRVAVGGSATSTIGTPGDQDRFAVELVAGRTYRFDLTGSPGGGGTLPDTFFRAIYNSAGQYQQDSYNDDFGGSRDSRVTFTPTESGTYYARVSGDRDETGSYTLSVAEVN